MNNRLVKHSRRAAYRFTFAEMATCVVIYAALFALTKILLVTESWPLFTVPIGMGMGIPLGFAHSGPVGAAKGGVLGGLLGLNGALIF